MQHRIAIIQGHPDPREQHLGHALAYAYADGATAAGHQVRHVIVAQLDVPVLRTREEWECGSTPDSILAAQETIAWADHLLIVFPLWLGTMPASFKAFLEQTLRPDFAIGHDGGRHGKLRGRSARVVVTMGMPALAYRWGFGAHGVRGLARSVLAFVGISPVRTDYIGRVESGSERRARGLLARMHKEGAHAG